MKFPAVNISAKKWDYQNIRFYTFGNEFVYIPSFELFEEHCLEELFVDSNGDIYKVTGRKLPSKILQFFSFIYPQLSKIEFTFTGQKLDDTEKLRTHLLTQISVLYKNDEFLDSEDRMLQWMDSVKKATTIEEMISS